MLIRVYKYLLYICLLLDVIIITYYLGFVVFYQPSNSKKIIIQNIDKPVQNLEQTISVQAATTTVIIKKQHERLVDGVITEDEINNHLLFAVLIDNLAEPIGLDKASVVYEALVEGGISRFMAIFLINKQLETNFIMGPIRSLRPYFVDWAEEVGAILTHVGGSDEALSKLANNNINTLNQFYKDQYFFNNENYKAPHHIFTSAESLALFSRNFSISGNIIQPWQFKDSSPDHNVLTDIESFTVKFSRNNIVKWVYDKNTKDYTRHPYNHIKAKNIVVQFTSVNVIDDVGRLRIKTSGIGKAKIFLDGKQINGKWIKLKNERTKFYDQSGNEVRFNRGATWIHVVQN